MNLNTSYYGVFGDILVGNHVTIHTKDINSQNWSDYREDLLNLFRDCIEQENFQNTFITFIFDDNTNVQLTVEDALINICMWGFVVNCNNPVEPRHIFFEEGGITKSSIKKYIDEFCIIPNRYKIKFSDLNNIIYTSLRSLAFVDEFGMYFNNSINIEDFIDMANACPEFDQLMHTDYSLYPAEQMNNIAMQNTNRMIELIMDSKKIMGREHCLVDALRAKVGVKPKQLRELIGCIGVKPNGEGGIAPYAITNSYINGGLNEIQYMVVESAVGRQAQILSKKNTADSGAFARVVGINCIDTKLYTNPTTGKIDPTYDCHTKNFIDFEVDSLTKLRMIADRYYRFTPMGMEYNVGCGRVINEYHPLLGKTIKLRSPITCASAAKGFGICRKCYGELFSANMAINVGKISAEEFTKRITQMMLSAKHLLEAKIVNPEWNIDIDDFFSIDDGTLSVNRDLNCKHWHLVINYDDINIESLFSLNDGSDEAVDEDIADDIEYVNKIHIVNDNGEAIEIYTKDYTNMYLSAEFTNFIQKKGYNFDDEESIKIPFSVLQQEEIGMFDIGINNDDMSNKLKNIINTINLKAITESFNKDEFVKNLLDKMIVCGIADIMSVHAEILIMNQIRDKDDVLLTPNWDIPDNENYQVLTLRRALTCNPSITVTCQYDNIAKTLYTPLSFRKRKPSQLDLFYHVQPQKFINSEPEEIDNSKPKSPFIRV